MTLHLRPVTEENFWSIINLKSEREQEKTFQIFERFVASNCFFIAISSVNGWTNRGIYDGDTLVGFATHGYDKGNKRYEIGSVMLGHEFQGKGYGKSAIQLVVEEMIEQYNCDEIYLTVIPENEPAIGAYKKMGFEPTGEIFTASHDEHVYKLNILK